eukprot:PhF_6_TR4934/c0_g1_i1/m.6996
MSLLMQCCISNNVDDLERLHEVHPWIPGRDQVRPSPEVRAQKEKDMAETGGVYDVNQWSVLLFDGMKWAQAQRFHDDVNPTVYAFIPNKYPYCVNPGTNHYVLWFPTPQRSPALTDESINRILVQCVQKIGGLDFVWYQNPKMTVQSIWHVQ